MSGFNLDDYKDVAERIREFSAKYPDGSLQSELVYMGEPTGWLCVAHAYRTPEDARPGVGHAFEPVPGKTPYTRDSEAQNAETAAWGRAIVALGFETKKIASKQEVRARRDSVGEPKPAAGVGSTQRKPPAAAASSPPKFKAPSSVGAKASIDSLTELYKLTTELGAQAATQEAVEAREEAGTLTQDWVDRCIATAKKNLAQKKAA